MLLTEEKIKWNKTIKASEMPANGGVCVKVGEEQIALYYFSKKNEWYATQNLCPHKQQMILSRGIIGDKNCEPKVACPYHKKSFSLKTGENLNGEEYHIKIYPVKVEKDYIYIGI